MSATEQQLQQQEQTTPPIEEQIEVPGQEESIEQDQQEQGKPQTASEVEELAREMGWAPQSEWRGPKESWKSAKDYIRHGSVIQRDLKSRYDIEKRDWQDRFDRLDRTSQVALKNQRKQLDDSWKARMREAVQLGDTEAFDRASQNREAALNKFDEEVESQAPASSKGNAPPDLPPEIIDFGKRHTWFDRDPIMTDVAVGISKGLAARHPAMPLGERLDAVEKEMRRRFPEEFGHVQQNGNGNPPRLPGVEGGLRPIKGAVKKGWDALPNEAKTAGAKFVREGLFKTKEDYANKYWEQE